MKPEHPLITVSRILDNRRPVSSGMYILHAVQQQIVLEKRESYDNPPGTIAILSSTQINNGLTTRRWDLIDIRIRILRKERKL